MSFIIFVTRCFSATPKRLFTVGTFKVDLNTRRSGSAVKFEIWRSAAITAWKYTLMSVMKSSMPPIFFSSSSFPKSLFQNAIIYK